MVDDKKPSIADRSLWSGSITFGLVSIPVHLLSGNRPRHVSLRMLAPDGNPLRRRYICPREERLLEPEEIVRGYEIEPDRYVVVSDEELDALEPQKSREIDLRRFVPLEQVDPSYFERAYYLAPDGDSKKTYLLLADTMERTGRAGIATFIMRGKEYLVAILSENGILKAEILRFPEEIRTPAQIGLPELPELDTAAVDALAAKITAAKKDELNAEDRQDPYARQLLELVRNKQQNGRDIIDISETIAEEEDDETGAQIIDLMEVLKKSLDLPG